MNDDIKRPSGRFLLRIDPELHKRLRERARAAGVSLNDYCASRLAEPASWVPPAGRAAIEYAEQALGGVLVGAVVYGSWARGEETADSDIDLMLVLPGDADITRDLYRRWDEGPPAWEGRTIEPHIVRLPAPGDEISSTWAEAALDGIVLHDPTLAVSRALGSIRHRIAEGEVARRTIQGQPYWTMAG